MSDDILNSMDDILDATIDDLADIPEFKPFPPGAHKCIVSFEEKVINKFPAVECKLKAVETMELSDPVNTQPLEAGATTNSAFFMKHSDEFVAKMGQGKLKEILKVLAPMYPDSKTSREVLKAASGSEMIVATGIREGKKNSAGIVPLYTDIVQMMPA